MKTSVLPNILDVAKKHGLQADPRTVIQKEVRFKCPFCLADANRPKKYFLSLNERKNVYKCWACQASGGVLKLAAFLEGKREQDLIEQLRKKKGFRYRKHMAEKLTQSQLKHIGYEKVDWIKNRKHDPSLYRLFRDHVLRKWSAFVKAKQEAAYQQLYVGLLTGNFQIAVERVKETEREIQVPLLEPACKKLSSHERSCEELESEVFAASICRQAHPFYKACDSLTAWLQSKKTKGEITMNHTNLIGRMTKDPEMKYTANGIAIVRFTLAVERPYKDKSTGKRAADFIQCLAWRKQAENIANYCKKGSQVGVTGRIQTSQFDGNDGNRVFRMEVVCESVQFLHTPKNSVAAKDGIHHNPFDSEAPVINAGDLPF